MRSRTPLGTEFLRLARLALPLAAVQAGNQLMGVVDTAVIGRLGPTHLGGVGLGNGIFFALSTLGIGTMLGLDPLISQAMGAGEPERARRLLWQGVWLAALVTVAITLPMAIAPSFLVPFGIEEEVAEIARTYLLVRLPGVFPFLLFFGLRSYLQALGATRALVVAMIVCNVVNAAADILLVFGGEMLPRGAGPLRSIPALGVRGAALATNLCLALQVGILVSAIRLLPGRGPVSRRPHGPDLRGALRVGVPVGLQMTAEVAIFALAGLLAGRMGSEALAAHQISLTLASFTFTVAVGIASAASVRVGWGIGAGDMPSVRRAGYLAIALGGGVMALGGLAFLLVPGALASLLTNDPTTIANARPILAVAALFAVSDGVQAVGAGVLRGAGDTRFAFLANLVGHWVISLPLCLWLSERFGVSGIWLGLAVGLTVVAALLVLRFRHLTGRPIQRLATA